jgi:hypothetical protein
VTRDDVIKMAKEVGIDAERDILCRYEGWVEPLERFAAFAFAAGAKAAQPKSYEEQRAILIQYLQVIIEQHMSYDSIHTCHDECQRPACVAVREAVKAERDRCILMLERLHERSGEQYNYYLHAAKVLKGEA